MHRQDGQFKILGPKFSESSIASTPVSSLRSAITSYLLLKSFFARLTPFLISALQVTAIVMLLYFHRLRERHTLWTNKNMQSFGMIGFLVYCPVGNSRKRGLPNPLLRRCRRFSFLLHCSASKMPSNSEFHSAQNFDARVRSIAFLHSRTKNHR